ncbi:MAG: hypothetical protein BZY80_06595, partial [SAR202 cluster bacterium Io17-Chloro-G2]
MVFKRFKSPAILVLTPLILLLSLALACGGTAAEPVVVEKEVIKEVPVEKIVVQEVVKEVPVEKVVEKVVEKEVIKEVVKEVIATAVPVPTPAAVVAEWVKVGESKHMSGFLQLIASRNPGFWDVHYGGSLNTTLIPSGPRFNQLLEYNPVNPTEIIGDLAKTWSVSEDGLTWTFVLHDAQFSDGSQVTADDVEYSLNRITEPDALRARTGFLRRFVEHGATRAIDDKTVEVPTKFKAATFIPNLASDYMKIYPRALESVSQDEFNCCPENSFGSGPWMFKSWDKDAQYSYDKNPNYFKEGRPFFDGIDVFIVRDVSRTLAALQTGQVVGTYQPVTGGYPPIQMRQMEEDTDGEVRALILSNVGLHYLWMTWTEPPFDDPRVRRAMYLGIDREAVVKGALKGDGTPGTFFKPGVVESLAELPSLPGYNPDRSVDIAEAKRLLTEAGYPEGFDVEATVVTGVSQAVMETFAPQLRNDLGIDITINAKGLAEFYVDLRDGSFPLSMVGTGIILQDPGDILNQFFDQGVLRNPQGWSD